MSDHKSETALSIMCGELTVQDAAKKDGRDIAEIESWVQSEQAVSYLLAFLRPNGLPAGDAEVEYRLACSGELHRARVETYDWRKSDMTRLLLQGPIGLFVNSTPFNSYPQELCVRFRVPLISKRHGTSTSLFRPDKQVVDELAAILTLLFRRLVAPVAKTYQRVDDSFGVGTPLAQWLAEFPEPVLRVRPVAHWRERPATVITSFEGQEVQFNDPPPLAVDDEALRATLVGLAKIKEGPKVLRAARAYATALELIETRPEIAYMLLIASAETLAGCALDEWTPPEDEQLRSQSALRTACEEQALPAEQVDKLVLANCRSNPWAKGKFVKYLSDHATDELAKPDRVFPYLLGNLLPRNDELESALKAVYSCRSGATHGGRPFPPSALIGTSSGIPVEVFHESVGIQTSRKRTIPVPPLPWFERVVSVAHRNYVAHLTGTSRPITTES